MKKLKLFMIISIFFIPFIVKAEVCKDDKVSVSSITMEQKSENIIEVNNANVNGKNIQLDLNIFDLEENIEYKIVLKNESDEDYEISENALKANSDFIEYMLTSEDALNIVKANSTKTVYLTVKYQNEVPSEAFTNGTYSDNQTINLNLSKPIMNPKTGGNLIIVCTIILIVTILIFTIYSPFKKKKQILGLIAVAILIPLSVQALCTYSINIEANIKIREPNVMQSVYVTLPDGTRDESIERGYWQYKKQIENITFRNRKDISDLEIAQNCGDSNTDLCAFDVSEKQNETIMSYLVTNSNGLYDCYIVANGSIYAPKDSHRLFGGDSTNNFSNLQTINNINILKTNHVEDMSGFFIYAASLKELQLSTFNTSNVTNMDYMFGHCPKLEYVDVSHFNTSKVTTMSNLFVNDIRINNIDVSNWDVSNVNNMFKTFRDCPSLTSIDISKWNTSKVTNFAHFFSGDTSLTGLDISHLNTSSATNISSMFQGISDQNDIDFNKLDISNVKSMEGVFMASQYTTIDISKWDTSKVENMKNMFRNCPNLTTIYVGDKWSTESATNTSTMFYLSPNIVGQNGTTFNSSYIGKSRAVIDTAVYDTDGTLISGTPGYLSYKAND